MNQKVSFSQSPAYLTKVKKDMPSKGAAKPFKNDNVQEQRHEKINFKQYLRDLKEEQNSTEDEFTDVELLNIAQAYRQDIREADDSLVEQLRIVNFGGAFETQLAIYEEEWNEVVDLGRGESMTITDSYGDRWYLTRSASNHLVVESHDNEYSGKFEFDLVVKRLG